MTFKTTVNRTASVLGQVLLGGWFFVILIPLFVAVLSSLKTNNAIYRNPLGLDFATLRPENFIEALQGPQGGAPLWTYVGNSVIASVGSIVIGMSAGILAAYGLARTQTKLSGILNRVFTVLITVPILATLVPLFTLTGALGIRDNPFGLALVYAAFMVPPTTVMMRPYFAAVPRELIEAATLDGATEVRVFLSVVLPVVFPTVLGIIVINVIWAWSELAISLVLLISPGSKTLPVGLLTFQGEYTTNLGVQAAGLLLAAAPMVVIYFIFSRRITDGMAAGVFK